MNIQLLQNNYREGLEIVPGLVPYNHKNPFPYMYESYALMKIFEKGEYKKAKYTGLFSPSFFDKTKIDGYFVSRIIVENPGHDVYFFNPYLSEVALHYNMWTQAEMSHPGIWPLAREAILSTHQFDISHIGRTTTKTTTYCNYWVGSKRFWEAFMSFYKKVSDYAFQYPERYLAKTNYIKSPATFYPFIMERALSTFLSLNQHFKTFSYHHNDLSLSHIAPQLQLSLELDTRLASYEDGMIDQLRLREYYQKLFSIKILPPIKHLNLERMLEIINSASNTPLKTLIVKINKQLNLQRWSREKKRAFLAEFEMLLNSRKNGECAPMFSEDFFSYLYSPSKEITQDQSFIFLNMHTMFRQLSKSSREMFPIKRYLDRKKFSKWCQEEGIEDVLLPTLLR